jgi:hypothetical protein
VPVPEFLPEEFFIRINENGRWGDADAPRPPFINGYRPKGIIQHHRGSNHFRCIRFLGKAAIVMDNDRV